MAVDWRLRGLVWLASRFEVTGPRLTPANARAEINRATQGLGAWALHTDASIAEARDFVVEANDVRIPLRMYRPDGTAPLPIVMYFHGGGWVVGGPDSHDSYCRALCVESGAIVLSVDYRLAPEHRFPAALDDCYAATSWAAANASSLGGDDARIAVAGDSSGGNLAAAVALMARDRGGPRLVQQTLIYPVTDGRMNTASYASFARGFLLSRDRMRWYWDQYVPDPALREDPYASPNRAVDFGGLPPAQIFTAEYDVLRDEGEAYAEALRHAGNVGECHRVPGMVHGYAVMLRVLPAARSSLARVGSRLRDAFGTG